MYKQVNGKQIWIDEPCKYVIGKDLEDNDIKVDAIKKETGIWIDNGTMLVEPTQLWIEENQPILPIVVPPPTTEEKLLMVQDDQLMALEAIAEVYEANIILTDKLTAANEDVMTSLEAIAEIYEMMIAGGVI